MSEALRKAQAAMAAKRAAGEEIERLDPIQRAHANPSSLRKAINGKCWDCVGAGHDPNPRKAIGRCPMSDCTLWNVRPYQKYADSPELDETTVSTDSGVHSVGEGGSDDLI